MSKLPAQTQEFKESLAAAMLSKSPAPPASAAAPVESDDGVTVTVGEVVTATVAPQLFSADVMRPSISAAMEGLEEYREYLLKFAEAEKDNIAGASAAALNHVLGDIESGPYSQLVAAVALAVLPREIGKLSEARVKNQESEDEGPKLTVK